MKIKLIPLLFLSFLTSCKTIERVVEVEKEVVKTEYTTKTQRDSIYIQDSVIITQKGDTVFVNKYKYAYIDKLRIDTLLKVDTLNVIQTKVEKVNILTAVQKVKNKLFWWVSGALVFALVWIFRKKLLKLVI